MHPSTGPDIFASHGFSMSDLVGLGAGQILRRLGAREVSAVEVTRAYLERINAIDPELNALRSREPAKPEGSMIRIFLSASARRRACRCSSR